MSERLGLRQFIYLFLAAVIFTAAEMAAFASSAASPANNGVVQFDWRTPQNEPCEMSCLYKKGNETLSLEALYLIKKVQALEGKPESELRANLSGFCVPGEHGSACFERFRDFTMLRLRRIRAAIASNAAAVSALYDERQDRFVARGTTEGSGTLPVLPHVPTFEELQAQRMREVELRSVLGAEEYEWNGRVPYRPELSEYVKYREIPRDPSRPDGETLLVPDTSCGSPICYDVDGEDGFQANLRTYEAHRSHFEDNHPLYSRFQASPARFQRPPVLDEQSEGEVSVLAYNEARDALVERANEVIAARAHGMPVAGSGAIRTAAEDSRGPASAQPQGSGQKQILPVPPGPNSADIFVTFAPQDLSAIIKGMEETGGRTGATTGPQPSPAAPAPAPLYGGAVDLSSVPVEYQD